MSTPGDVGGVGDSGTPTPSPFAEQQNVDVLRKSACEAADVNFPATKPFRDLLAKLQHDTLYWKDIAKNCYLHWRVVDGSMKEITEVVHYQGLDTNAQVGSILRVLEKNGYCRICPADGPGADDAAGPPPAPFFPGSQDMDTNCNLAMQFSPCRPNVQAIGTLPVLPMAPLSGFQMGKPLPDVLADERTDGLKDIAFHQSPYHDPILAGIKLGQSVDQSGRASGRQGLFQRCVPSTSGSSVATPDLYVASVAAVAALPDPDCLADVAEKAAGSGPAMPERHRKRTRNDLIEVASCKSK